MDSSCDTNIMRKSIPMYRRVWICIVMLVAVAEIGA